MEPVSFLHNIIPGCFIAALDGLGLGRLSLEAHMPGLIIVIVSAIIDR